MKTFALTLLLLLSCLVNAQGGPPLFTDDPGTVDSGKWELNLSWVHRVLRGRIENELPHFDASHGFSRNAHFKIEVPWVFVSETGSTVSGDGCGSTGVKWRFLDAKGSRPAISTYPQIGFSIAPRSVRVGLSEGGTSLLLPLQVEWDLPSITVGADFGIVFQASAHPGWIGGVTAGGRVGSSDLLAELHAEGVWSTGELIVLAQLGLRHDFTPSSTLLFSFGRSVVASRTDELRWTSYLGIQLHF